jgi:type I restriction enzyme S subunit
LTEQAIGLLGSTAIIPESNKYIQSQDVAKIICNETLLYPLYAFYLISSEIVKKQLSAAAQQTKIRHTSPDKIKDCIVWIPELPEQKRIASILSALDKKIALNRQINENLEALARQLYDYWFVQFDFPDANGKPYKSSGGKMVYNSILKREIPEGWEYVTANEITNVVTGKEDANFSTPDGKFPFFTCSRENLLCSKAAFSGKAILIAGNGDFNVKHYNGEFNAYQRTYVLIPNDEKYYGVLYFSATGKIDIFRKGANGSIVKFITKGDVEQIGVFNCKNENLYAFINDLILQIENNNAEIASLTKQRAELLPLLMNGQVTVE